MVLPVSGDWIQGAIENRDGWIVEKEVVALQCGR
jgi:hypothetical protein